MKEKNQDLTGVEPLMTIEEILESIDGMLEDISLNGSPVKTGDSFFLQISIIQLHITLIMH